MMSTVAVPVLWQATDRYRTMGAVRHVVATLHHARADAIVGGASVALRFAPTADGIRFTTYRDGDRDGVSTADILDGTDPVVATPRGLGEFGAAAFGVWPGISAPDGTVLSDGDPIRVGAANLVSLTPDGTATPGTLYVRGPGGLQYAIRIHGDTGKAQILRYARGERTWRTQ